MFDSRSNFDGANLEGQLSFRRARMEGVNLDQAIIRAKVSGQSQQGEGEALVCAPVWFIQW